MPFDGGLLSARLRGNVVCPGAGEHLAPPVIIRLKRVSKGYVYWTQMSGVDTSGLLVSNECCAFSMPSLVFQGIRSRVCLLALHIYYGTTTQNRVYVRTLKFYLKSVYCGMSWYFFNLKTGSG